MAGGLEIEAAALFRENELYAERIIRQQFLPDTFFLVAAGFAMCDHHGQPLKCGLPVSAARFGVLNPQGRGEMTEERFDRLFIGKRDFDEQGLSDGRLLPAGLWPSIPGAVWLNKFHAVGARIPEIQ